MSQFYKFKHLYTRNIVSKYNSSIDVIRNYRQLVYNNVFDLNNFKKDSVLYAADIFYNALMRNNVDTTFIYSGGSVMPLIDKLYNSDIKYYINSHEQNCGHAATGYAKSSNKPGTVMVTSGPGITNMITPMLDASNDSTPLVVFSGQVSLSAVGSNAFQEAPAVELSKNVTKWSYQIKNILDIDSVIDDAYKIAMDGKRGTVHIDIPKCVASAKVPKKLYFLNNNAERNDSIFKSSFKEVVDPILNFSIENKVNNIEYIVDIINSSDKPVLYLGQGANRDFNLVREFAIKGNIPVTNTIHSCGVFDDDHSLSLRWCGMHGSAAANYSIQDADCVIALGSRFDDRTTGLVEKYAPEAFKSYSKGKGGIIHINIEQSEIKKVVDSHYNLHMSCKDFLDIAVKRIKYKEREPWITQVNFLKEKHQFKRVFHDTDSSKLYMEDVLTKIYEKTKCLNDKVIFTTGVGNHQMQTYQYIKSHFPNKIISSGSLGVMGAGLPYAVGAQIANPDKVVIAIDGDSSFNMTLTDMKTIVENNLPIKIAIMNNDAQMMVTIWERLFFNERYTATLNKNNPDFTKLAEGYGLKALKCETIHTLDETLKEFLEYNGPILCEFKIEKGICLPLVGPGKALDDMILPENYDTNIKITDGMAPS